MSIGCNYGGTLGFSSNNAGTKTDFVLNKCALVKNFILTGTGLYNVNNDRFVLDVSTTGRWKCDLKYVRKAGAVNITGKCDGRQINENHIDEEYNFHKVREFSESK